MFYFSQTDRHNKHFNNYLVSEHIANNSEEKPVRNCSVHLTVCIKEII